MLTNIKLMVDKLTAYLRLIYWVTIFSVRIVCVKT